MWRQSRMEWIPFVITQEGKKRKETIRDEWTCFCCPILHTALDVFFTPSPHFLSMMIILALWVENLLSLPLSEVFEPMLGWWSRKWRGIPSTRTLCGLITPVTRPLACGDVHHLFRVFIQTWSPMSYPICSCLGSSGGRVSITFSWTR